MRLQTMRRWFMGFFFLAAVVLTLRNLSGFTKATVESYCPGGGLESIIFYLKENAFICATSGINLILFVAVFLGSILIGRAFCSWVCPIGTLGAFLRFCGEKARILATSFWKGPWGNIGWLRFVILAAILYSTYQVKDLVFRPFCPLYVVMSGQDHEIAWWSKWVMLALGTVSLSLPFFFCRLICPLGAAFSPTRLVSPLAPTIRKDDCISCGACDRACPQQIEVLKSVRVNDKDCTQCLECVSACLKQCIDMQFGYAPVLPAKPLEQRTWVQRGIVVPVLVAVMMLTGFVFAFQVKLPTLKQTFPLYETKSGFAQVDMIVQGLRCRGMSGTLAFILENEPGIAYLETYVSEFRARFLFDPAQTNPQKIKEAIERGRERPRKGKRPVLLRFNVEKILP